MSTPTTGDRLKQIERQIAQKREQIQFHKNNLEKWKDDPDMMADAGVTESGRINMLTEEIAKLEEEREKLRKAGH